jgi:diaminopimelate decarboxylase
VVDGAPGLRALLLSEEVGQTPHLVYDLAGVQASYELMRDEIRATLGAPPSIHFAMKACYDEPVLTRLLAAGAGAEVMTGLELDTALRLGFPGDRLVFNGLGRPLAALRQACQAGARVCVDSAGDLDRLVAAAAASERPVRVGIRVRLDVSQFPHSPYARSRVKLGVSPDRPRFWELVARIAREPGLTLDFLHVHAGINETTSALSRALLAQLRRVRAAVEARWPTTRLTAVDLGGGLAQSPDDALTRATLRDIGSAFAEHFPDLDLILEPGRFVVNSSGYVVATVTDLVADDDEDFWHVLTDATTNVLIPTSAARYAWWSPPKGDAYAVSITDGITSPDNVVVPYVRVGRLPRVGERIVLANCGAYTNVFHCRWGYDPFPVSYVDRDGRLRPILSREAVAGYWSDAHRATQLEGTT